MVLTRDFDISIFQTILLATETVWHHFGTYFHHIQFYCLHNSQVTTAFHHLFLPPPNILISSWNCQKYFCSMFLILKCDNEESWRRSVGLIVQKMKYYTVLKKEGISYIWQKEGKLPGLVTSYTRIVFKTIFKER